MKYHPSPFRSIFFPRTFVDPRSFSGRNDKALADIIQQRNLPGSKAARADIRRLSKGQKRGRR